MIRPAKCRGWSRSAAALRCIRSWGPSPRCITCRRESIRTLGERAMSASTSRYDQLIQDLRSELRPQRTRGEGRGVFMVIGHFVLGVAAGAWLLGLIYESRAGLTLA